jgi:hypothetical protein
MAKEKFERKEVHGMSESFSRLSAALTSHLDPKPEHIRRNLLRSFLNVCSLGQPHLDRVISHLLISGPCAPGDRTLTATELYGSLSEAEKQTLKQQCQGRLENVRKEFPEFATEFPKIFQLS